MKRLNKGNVSLLLSATMALSFASHNAIGGGDEHRNVRGEDREERHDHGHGHGPKNGHGFNKIKKMKARILERIPGLTADANTICSTCNNPGVCLCKVQQVVTEYTGEPFLTNLATSYVNDHVKKKELDAELGQDWAASLAAKGITESSCNVGSVC